MRSLLLSAVAALALLPSVALAGQSAVPPDTSVCRAGAPAQPDQVIAACSADVKLLKLQEASAKKHATKCRDEDVWDQSTRHPNNPDWIVNPLDRRSFLPTAGNPHTPDCAGFYGSFNAKTFDEQIAKALRTRADVWFAQKKYSAAYNDYDESYTTFHNEDVFKAREQARKALKQARKALKRSRKKS